MALLWRVSRPCLRGRSVYLSDFSSRSSPPSTAQGPKAGNRFDVNARSHGNDTHTVDLPGLEKQITRRGVGGAYSPSELNWVDQKEEPWRQTSPFLPPPPSGLVSRSRRHLCALRGCEDDVHFTNIKLLEYFVSDTTGQIKPRRQTGLTAKMQRKVAHTIKQARQLGMIPYVEPFTTVDQSTLSDVRRAAASKRSTRKSKKKKGD